MSTTAVEALAIFGAGIAAGTINTVVGSGTLITFPTLIGFGFPPVLANVSNNVGLVPGTLSGIYGYREELAGQRARVLRLGSASLLGGLVGAFLLLVLPQSAFKAIVPALIAIALIMVIAQPALARRVAARRTERGRVSIDMESGPAARTVPYDASLRAPSERRGYGENQTLRPVAPRGAASASERAPGADPASRGGSPEERRASSRRSRMLRPALVQGLGGRRGAAPPWETGQTGGPVLWVLVFLTGIYGGYFGAAQGILLLGLLGITFSDGLQRINAVKNVLACTVNAVAAVVFIAATHIDWVVAALIAAGSIIGGQVGARVGRKLPPWGLRAIIVCVGVAALVRLLA